MWVLTPWGPLMPSLRKNCPADDPRTIQIRFRRVKDAVYCQQHYLIITDDSDSPIITDAGTDYDARIYVRTASLQSVMSQLVYEIDYASFKDQTTIKHKDHKLHDAYYAIWHVLYDRLSTRKAFTRTSYVRPRQQGKRLEQERITETVYRTENREWRMKGASPKEIADLMREIDCATEGVELPSDEELTEMNHQIHNDLQRRSGPTEVNGRLDHSRCTHSDTVSARKKCRQRFYRSS